MRAQVAADLKISNRRTVYSLLRSAGMLSKAEIGRLSGISPPTVMKIVDHFKELGFLSEGGEGEGALGRKPQLLSFVPEAAYTLGALYDGRKLALGLADLAGNLKALRRSAAPHDLRALLEEHLPAEAAALLAEKGMEPASVRGLGIGVPGVVDPSGRVVRLAPLAGIHADFDSRALLEKIEAELGCPVLLENDANAAALGEHAARAPEDGKDLVFVELGRGLGSGIILDGKLRRGPRSMAGEIGYLVLDPAWRASTEAPGWLEGRMDLDEFWAEAEGGGSPSAEALRRVVSYLALGLANICVTMDIGLVVLGREGMERFGADFLRLLQAELSRLSVLPTRCEASALAVPGVSGAAGLVAEAWLETVFAA